MSFSVKSREKELLSLCAEGPSSEDAANRIGQLVRANVNVNCRNENWMTPLLLLCQSRNPSDQLRPCIQQLLSQQSIKEDEDSLANSLVGHLVYFLCLRRTVVSYNYTSLYINCTNRHGVNALLLLSRNYSREDLIDIFRLLIQNGIDVNVSTDRWNALLLLARYYPHKNLLDLIELLVAHGINVNFKNLGGLNVLHILFRYYNGNDLKQIVRFLLEKGVDFNAPTHRSRSTPLLLLCQYKNDTNLLKIIKLLIKYNVDLNATASQGWNALITLCRYYLGSDLIEIIRLLLRNGADIYGCTNDGVNALMMLCGHYANDNLFDLIQLMVEEYEACVCATTKDGWNALLLLCQHYAGRNLITIIQFLIDKGVNINYQDENGWNALLFLCQCSSADDSLLDIVRLLVRSGINLKATTSDGCNALLLLCRYYNHENLINIVTFLIDSGIDLSCTDNGGWNALTILCRFYREENLIDLLQLLIERGGMDPNSRTTQGWTAAMTLCRYYVGENLKDIIKMLIDYGADINTTAKDGTNAVFLLAHNWSGQLHTVLESFPIIRIEPSEDVFKQVLLKAAELGCLWTVVVLLKQMQINVVDGTGRDAFEYLEDWVSNSCSLCGRCQELGILTSFDSRRSESSFTVNRLRRLSKRKCPIFSHHNGRTINYDVFKEVCRNRRTSRIATRSSVYSFSIFRNDPLSTSNCNFRVDPVESQISPPSFLENWREIYRSVHARNVIPLAQINSYLDRHSHPADICQPAERSDDCSWCRVAQHVEGYLQMLMEDIKIQDKIFEIKETFPYGSSAEKTNIFHPYEFDRGVVPKYFRHEPIASDPYRVVFDNDAFDGHCPNLARRESINSNSMLFRFKELMNSAIDRVYFVHAFAPTLTLKETCVTLTFLYRGLENDRNGDPPPIAVSVDITIMIPTEVKTLDCAVLYKWFRETMRNSSEEREEYLVPYRRVNRPQSWRISYPTLSRDIILRAGATVSRVFKLLKLLVVLHHARESPTIPRKTSITSYALKTCLFKYLRGNPPGSWRREDMVHHAIGILRFFPMNASKMMSFFVDDIIVFHITQRSKETVSSILDKLEHTPEDR